MFIPEKLLRSEGFECLWNAVGFKDVKLKYSWAFSKTSLSPSPASCVTVWASVTNNLLMLFNAMKARLAKCCSCIIEYKFVACVQCELRSSPAGGHKDSSCTALLMLRLVSYSEVESKGVSVLKISADGSLMNHSHAPPHTHHILSMNNLDSSL